jgi:ribosome recycling factor
MKLVDSLVSGLRRRLLGISAEEIRYTFEDVRKEIRAVRAELKDELAAVRKDIDSLPSRQDRAKGPEIPVAEA